MRTRRILPALAITVAVVIGACSDDPTSPDVRPVTIQDRVDAAAPGDTILLEPGTYTDFHEFTDLRGFERTVAVVLKPGVVLRGATGNPADVVIDIEGAMNGIWLYEAGDSTGIADLTIRNATWAIGGYDASPWIANCVFENNGTTDERVSAAGTGIYFDKSSSVIRDCTFRNNEARRGAGATFENWSHVRLERCQFIDNHATHNGGGLSVSGESSAALVDCTFLGNTAGTEGGGISVDADFEMTGGSIIGNSAGIRGGGCDIRVAREHARFEGVTISDNAAPEGPEGRVSRHAPGTVVLRCCETDPSGWYSYSDTEITWENEGCDP
jgi:predicted outer membrane repeat protein